MQFKYVLTALLALLFGVWLTLPMPALATGPESASELKLANMGRQIFFDSRFSSSGKTSCASCHQPEWAFSDNRPLSVKDNGEQTLFSAPPLFDLNRKLGFFSDRPVFSLKAAIRRCMTDNMSSPVLAVYSALRQDRTLSVLASDAYGRVSAGAVYQGLYYYLSSLQATESRYDRYRQGRLSELTRPEQKGMVLFDKKGCRFCHTGRDMGGNVYARPVTSDQIREVQVPRLRNLAQTAPYFSDGSAASLRDAIRMMNQTYNKAAISETDLELIRLFLLSHQSSVHDFEGPVLYDDIR